MFYYFLRISVQVRGLSFIFLNIRLIKTTPQEENQKTSCLFYTSALVPSIEILLSEVDALPILPLLVFHLISIFCVFRIFLI